MIPATVAPSGVQGSYLISFLSLPTSRPFIFIPCYYQLLCIFLILRLFFIRYLFCLRWKRLRPCDPKKSPLRENFSFIFNPSHGTVLRLPKIGSAYPFLGLSTVARRMRFTFGVDYKWIAGYKGMRCHTRPTALCPCPTSRTTLDRMTRFVRRQLQEEME